MRATVAMTIVGLVIFGPARDAVGAAFDRPGYGRLSFGMTKAQVAKAHPKLRLVQAGHYDLHSPLKWVGRTWRTVAVFRGGRLAAVMVLTAYDPAHFQQVVKTAGQDLGRPRVFRQKLLFWRQSRRVIVLGWTQVSGRPTTFMRFMPSHQTAVPKPSTRAPPRTTTKKPGLTGKKPVSGIYRATGEYKVCSGRVPYRFCFSRFVWGAGRTETEAQINCNNHLSRMVTIHTMGGSTAYLTRYCRVIK
ncbi:MAG: hypothetical protein KJ621_18090 [Proteobacteria bacterium]|nr:hypothetical protein [Pseudomonadota bacterium]